MRIELLFGFLGSGKTTLASRILKEWGPRERLALIVNEFGEVGVDGDILRGNAVDTIELSSGCLCCSLKGSMLNAVEELAQRKVDHIVVEATGVASPEEMLDTFADPGLKSRFVLGPMTTVVDAAKFPKLKAMLGPFFESQIIYADLLVLNKIDLAAADDVEKVRAEVRELNPEAVVRLAERCDINLSLLMAGPPSTAVHSPHQDEHDHDHDHDHGHDHRHAPADSLMVDVQGEISRASLDRFFSRLPEELWRAKGFVRVDGKTSLVQFAMGELEVTPAAPRDRHYLVFIGKDLDRAGIARDVRAIEAREAAA